MSTASSVALQEGLTTRDEHGRDRLVASRCPHCELVFFPRRTYCGKCGESGQAELLLAAAGTVVGFSVIGLKGAHTVIEPPYVQAEVAMPEGVHVFTVLDQVAPEQVRTGMDVEVYVAKVTEDAEGNDVVAFKFRPVEGGHHE